MKFRNKKTLINSDICVDLAGNETDFGFIKKRIKNKIGLKTLNLIKEDWHSVRKEGKLIRSKRFFNLKIDKYKIWLRRDIASSSIDTYLEIFKKHNHVKLKKFLDKTDKLIVDIGANEGFYTLFMKQNLPSVKIICVEPAPLTFRILKRNINSNHLKKIRLINKAITVKKGNIPFEIVPEITVVGGLDISLQKRPWLNLQRIKKIYVPSTTLQNLCKQEEIKEIDLLKIDAEGSELDVLKSAGNLLRKIKKIVIEWHTPKLKKECIFLLKKNEFKLIYGESHRCGDLYFINKEMLFS